MSTFDLKGIRVLVVDDEKAIRRFLHTVFCAHGTEIAEASSGFEALAAAAAGRPDLVVLDLGLPDMDGLDVIRRLREWSEVPIIVLSVRESEDQKIGALDAGAVDYVTKPFGTGELLARVRAALRRASPAAAEPVFRSGDLEVDLADRRVRVGGIAVALTPNEFDLLRLFVLHAGKVFTHRQVLVKVWGPGYAEDRHLLRVNVSNLRRKIEADASRPRHLVTEPGVGYRLLVHEPPG
ncbi:MAG: response regulator [Acidobacteria bacterium]|nr:response regulator [Acidobacteriota bacterium]